MNYLTPEQILFLHGRLIEETGGSHGVRDLGLLVAAVERPRASNEGQEFYRNLFTKAEAVMHSLIQNHPFTDGNKRTGVAAAALFMRANIFRLSVGNQEVESIALRVAQGEMDVPEPASWLEEHSQPHID